MARILVIDDDELIRGTVQVILASDGHESILAVDGEDGMRQFQRQQFDLVLCDVFMPHKEGLETVREIRQLSAGTPIISMTGSIPTSDSGRLDPDFLRMSSATRGHADDRQAVPPVRAAGARAGVPAPGRRGRRTLKVGGRGGYPAAVEKAEAPMEHPAVGAVDPCAARLQSDPPRTGRSPRRIPTPHSAPQLFL